MIRRLDALVDPGTICRIYGVTVDDLTSLALVEDLLKDEQNPSDR